MPTHPIENVPAPGIPPTTGGGDTAVAHPIASVPAPVPKPVPVPTTCAQISDTRACFGPTPQFCSAKTKSGKTLSVSYFAGACQNHMVAALKEKACLAKAPPWT